jgi:Transcriptional regulator
VTTARENLLAAGLAVFDRDGFEGATVAAIRTRARASNGSFFHFFGSKKELPARCSWKFSPVTTSAVIAAVDESCPAREGVARLIRAHLEWVVNSRREARYLFEDFPQRMDRGDPWCAARAKFAPCGSRRAMARATG